MDFFERFSKVFDAQKSTLIEPRTQRPGFGDARRTYLRVYLPTYPARPGKEDNIGLHAVVGGLLLMAYARTNLEAGAKFAPHACWNVHYVCRRRL